MKYPEWKCKGNPTPNDKLIICDKCQCAEYTMHSDLLQYHSKCSSRMREATKKEYQEAKKALKEII